MSKTLGIILVIIILGGIGFYAFSDKDDAMMEKDDDSMMMEGDSMMEDGDKKDDAMMEEGDSMMMKGDDDKMEEGDSMSKSGSYEVYSKEKLSLANNGDVVLFFKADWCPTCKALDSSIKTGLDQIPSNVTILEVDYDNSTELKQKYGVTYQHTLVQVDASGEMIAKWSGSPTLSDLLSEIK